MELLALVPSQDGMEIRELCVFFTVNPCICLQLLSCSTGWDASLKATDFAISGFHSQQAIELSINRMLAFIMSGSLLFFCHHPFPHHSFISAQTFKGKNNPEVGKAERRQEKLVRLQKEDRCTRQRETYGSRGRMLREYM